MPFLGKSKYQEFGGVIVWEISKNTLGAALLFVGVWIRERPLGWFLLGLGLGILLTYLIKLVYAKVFPVPHFQALECDFMLCKKVITFRYVDRDKAIYSKRLTVRALRSGLEAYRDKYRWTGATAPQLRTTIPGQSIRVLGKRNVWDFYEIAFPNVLRKKDQAEVEVVFELGSALSATPFVSATIDEPTLCLEFNLALPEAWKVPDCVCEVSSGMTSRIPLRSEVLPLEAGKIKWTIQDPKLLHHYEIRWQLSQDIYEPTKIGAAAGE